jgi:monoterpene epsilon-lactone hydrolase
MSEPVNEAVEAVIARVKQTYGRWRRDTKPAQMRADWDALFSARGDARIEPVDAGGVPCEWVRAPGVRDDRAVLYFHGGGFQVGSLSSHRELMALLSAATGARVLGVGYRLAPEHRYPAALEDALCAFEWVQARGLAAEHVAMAGDSAGGGLALSAMLTLREGGRTLPAAGLLMSAWTDLTASGPSYQTRAACDPINQRTMILALVRNYLGNGVNAAHPRISPLFAKADALAALPPVLLQVGDNEIVLSDSEDFVHKARAAGARAELQVWPGMIHVFQQFPGELPEAREAIAAGGRFLAALIDAASPRKTSP